MITKAAFITGASGGLGGCFAKELAMQGWNLIISGRNIEKLEKLKNELEKDFNINIDILTADLSNSNDVQNVTAYIEKREDIYLFIAAAGYTIPTPFDTGDIEKQMKIVDSQVSANVRLTHSVLKQMNQRNEGTIIFVNSTMAFYNAPGNAIYCASKNFMNSFAESLSTELMYTNIKVQALNPGMMKTGFHETDEFKEIGSEGLGPDFLFMEPKDVVNASLKKLHKKQVIVIPGHNNRMSVKMKWLMKFIFKKTIMHDNMGRPIP